MGLTKARDLRASRSSPAASRTTTPRRSPRPSCGSALTSFFLSGGSHYFIDNVCTENPAGWDDVPQDVSSGDAGPWRGRAPYWRDWVLGGNDEARIKVQAVFMSSGNNVAFSRELNRRLVPIELTAWEEIPSLRTGFGPSIR